MELFDLSAQPLWILALIFLLAGLVVWIGGVRLTHALDALAEKTGLGGLFVGMLLLGGITSLPEVANVIAASASGLPRLAINNLLGSAAINVLLLAIADAFVGRNAASSGVTDPATLMMSALCMMVLALVATAVTIGDIAIFGMGAWGMAITVASIAAFALAASYGKRAPWALRDAQADRRSEKPKQLRYSLRRLVAISAVAGAAIFLAGYVLSETGAVIAEETGLGAGFVGFMLIGIATSMPELSTVVTALRLRRHEMAFGQVLGTNFVNLSLFALADGVFRGGPVVNELGRFEILSALLGLLLIGAFLIGLLERRDATILRMGYDSFAVIILFLGGSGLLYVLR